MDINVQSIKGEKIGTVSVPKSFLGVKWNPDLTHQVVVAQDANSRSPWAHTKDRSDVRGGGKKPWKQKGTGRARHGSIRSPLWIGGGATFGPRKERSFSVKINKKMRQNAIFSVLSKKFKENELIILDKLLTEKENKTNSVAKSIKSIFKDESLTVIFATENKGSNRFLKNLKKVSFISPKSLNAKDLLRPKKIVLEEGAVEEIIKHYNLK